MTWATRTTAERCVAAARACGMVRDEREWWTSRGESRNLNAFETDLNATAELEREVAKRGLEAAYRDSLLRLRPIGETEWWWLIAATPHARLTAALTVLVGTGDAQ